ncbi:CAP domain-containing protein [Kocuria sp. ZOR0020]|uniref:CAP domain-containing protein n=1 Tax=Kocuria sp. ZOR0020 TaxID=1339234 RepID=UPI0006490757|nr:CAP domain-containing protein [Kocuria sp. ZOR0020]
MKKTLVTTAAVLALAGAAAAPASAADCFGSEGHAPSSSFSSSLQQDSGSAQTSVGEQASNGAQTPTDAQAPSGADASTVTTQSTATEGGDASSSSFSDQVAQEMLGMLNQARAEAGLSPLSSNADLTGIASGWSQQMAANNAASHSPTFIDQTLATGSTNMAENVSYDVTSGKSVQETAQYFYNFWMNSPGHHANIMNPELNSIGFSLAESSNGYVYATQNFGTY